MAKKKKKEKQKRAFSKSLLIQESILIWIITVAFIGLALLCIEKDYIGELSWFNVIVGCSWSAYGVSQACYYSKSKKENSVGGITYDLAMKNQEQSSINEEEPTEEDTSVVG